MTDNLVCWKCGADISKLPFPLGRLSQCEACRADLHVCVLCKYFDKTRANQCREPVADPVTDKKRSNFCGYFEVKTSAYQVPDASPVSTAEQELAGLFGGAAVPKINDAESAKSELEKLFGGTAGGKSDNSES